MEIFKMENNVIKVVQDFLRFLNERDLENLTNLFSDNLDWYIPGDESNVEWLGKRENRQEVAEFYNLLWKNTEPLTAKINNIFTDKETGVIMGEFTTKMLVTNKILHSMFCIEMQIQNNKIVKYRLLEDSFAVSQAMTSVLRE